ncbi:O-antigen ligase family protein [uncultured Wocania sp.]|uniref:O-antigen ligase family protein n=1 Tax=uncultured Wocania sp. TaxID=2834404 RepID=UPI0030F8EEF6
MRKENVLFSLICVILLCALYLSIGVVSILGLNGEVHYNNIASLTIPSIIFFIVVCIFAIWRIQLYFLLLIFVLLAFPAPVDDIFPSIYISNQDDFRSVVFPLITRIDIYLILGVVIGLLKKGGRLPLIKFPLILKLFLLLFVLVFFFNVFKSNDFWDFNLLLTYSYHIRYFILFLILFQLFDIKKYESQIVNSFVISIVFLCFEAFVNTYFKEAGRLMSGSLALNTFANITGATSIFIYFLVKKKLISKRIAYLTFLVTIVILLGSGTRGALLSVIVTLLILSVLENPRKAAINFLKASAVFFISIIVYLYGVEQNIIPKRYSVSEISKKVNIDFSKDGLRDIFHLEHSWETNSIISRLGLFESSLNMIEKHPLTGIGAGRWNRYKNNYLEDKSIVKVLIDSHNDYLAMMSQYGIPLGLLFSYLVFLYPVSQQIKIRGAYNGPLLYLYVINLTMGIAAFSNAGFFKHQVASVLLFSVCCLNSIYFTKDENQSISN